MKKTLITCVCILFLTSALSSGVVAQDDVDSNFWVKAALEFPLSKTNKNIKGVISTDFRAIDDTSDFDDNRVGFAVKIKLNDNWSISPSYVFRKTERASGNDRYENRLVFDVVGKTKIKKVSFENRNRFDHRIKDQGRDDDTLYRNRSKFKFSVKKDGEELFAPYVAEELRFELHKGEFVRNELTLGISKKFSDNFSADGYYVWQRHINGSINHRNVIGVDLKFKIK